MNSQRPSRRPLTLLILGILLIIGAGVIWLANPPEKSALPTPSATISDESQVPRVSLTDAKAAFDNKQAIFVDTRDATSYSSGHIPGALSVPLAEIQSHMGELDRNAWIITYCT